MLILYTIYVDHLLKQECNYENISNLEDDLQTHYNYLTLGTGRLWRHVAKGGYTEDAKNNKNNLFKVFVTLIPKELVSSFNIKINK